MVVLIFSKDHKSWKSQKTTTTTTNKQTNTQKIKNENILFFFSFQTELQKIKNSKKLLLRCFFIYIYMLSFCKLCWFSEILAGLKKNVLTFLPFNVVLVFYWKIARTSSWILGNFPIERNSAQCPRVPNMPKERIFWKKKKTFCCQI